MKKAGMILGIAIGGLFLFMTTAAPHGSAQSTPGLIVAFSGDLRGYLQECG